MTETRKPTVLLVDGYSLIFRGFHALPILTTASGEYTNAVHGFFSMLFKALDAYRPDALCVMMDVHAPTFRHTMYEAYKGTRKPMPVELRPQLPLVRRLLSAMHIRICEMEGYEADDLLGTASRMANERGMRALVLTGDRDSLQLAGGDTQVILTRKGITESLLLDAQGVFDEYGFTPAQVPDMKGLMGDSSDNIPGIAGIGEKTALKLITQYGTLDEVLAHADEVKGKLGEKLRAGKEVALLSRDLGTIRRNAPLEVDFSLCGWDRMGDGAAMLEEYELKSLVRSMNALLNGEAAPAADAPRATAASRRAAGGGRASRKADEPAAASMAVERETDLPKPQPVSAEETYTDQAALSEAAAKLTAEKPEWIALHVAEEEISLLTPGMQLWRMPILRDLMGLGMYDDMIFAALKPLLETVPVIVHGAKALFHQLSRFRLPIPAIHRDTMIAAYLLHTAQKDYALASTLTAEYGDAKENPTAWDVYALSVRQFARIEKRNLTSLLLDMEQPLTRVLFDMEREGFLVDGEVLNDLGEWFTREVNECREAVYELSGVRDFNLNSPAQLSDVLFGKLGLPAPQKKSARGYSTSA
ncbi:MAG: 5'-3' exonuclease H3TH domain-containing protein, partial [bacterium]|nr:5'-3' exonuclease H3TH domain-containing protein [bacterium]